MLVEVTELVVKPVGAPGVGSEYTTVSSGPLKLVP